ncbi:MAG: hypothetical protein JHC95_22645 [Solirubrobacteraceae bacterium]|nr:hypothetical protein [Solirubrobacteraceae bacterium]
MPEIPVRIGELIATKDPDDVLVSVGLGSCIGLAMIDRTRGIVGLAHVMLPASQNGDPGPLKGRYANHAVPILFEQVTALGARKSGIQVGIAGGAQMFSSANSIEVGKRNDEAVRAALAAAGLQLVASETGGEKGRTVKVRADVGVMTAREVAGEELVLIGTPARPDLVGALR